MFRYSDKTATRDDVQAEIQNLMTALDELKHEASRGSQHRFNSLRARAESLWHDNPWDEHRQHLTKEGRKAGRMAKECARKHPLGTVALAAGAIALIGYLASRR